MIVEDFKNGYSLYSLKSDNLVIKVSDLGATLVSVIYKDKLGKKLDLVLGYDDSNGYLKGSQYFGANIGRYANRVDNASFVLDGKQYNLDKNDGPNCLHSGLSPYSKRKYEVLSYSDTKIVFRLVSPSLDQGFPGKLELTITYELEDESSFIITYDAISDEDTPISITNHSYFNLNGEGNGLVLNHKLISPAAHFNPVNDELIVKGEILTSKKTPLDFTFSRRIGERIDDPYLKNTGGYDHNLIVAFSDGEYYKLAEVKGDISGISMSVYSSYPSFQLYTGNYIGEELGKKGHIYPDRSALCIEPQFYPNAVNVESFPSSILKKYEKFYKIIRYVFKNN